MIQIHFFLSHQKIEKFGGPLMQRYYMTLWCHLSWEARCQDAASFWKLDDISVSHRSHNKCRWLISRSPDVTSEVSFHSSFWLVPVASWSIRLERRVAELATRCWLRIYASWIWGIIYTEAKTWKWIDPFCLWILALVSPEVKPGTSGDVPVILSVVKTQNDLSSHQ